jgi:hypothetical protein
MYREQTDRFDDFVQRLISYAAQHDGDVSPPKKYPADPELGAWVTAVRRLHTTGQVKAAHVTTLDIFSAHSVCYCCLRMRQPTNGSSASPTNPTLLGSSTVVLRLALIRACFPPPVVPHPTVSSEGTDRHHWISAAGVTERNGGWLRRVKTFCGV